MAPPVSVSSVLLDLVLADLREGGGNCSASRCTLRRSTDRYTDHAAHDCGACYSLFGAMVSMVLVCRICVRSQEAQRRQGQDNSLQGARSFLHSA
jgi:hypothetical protein